MALRLVEFDLKSLVNLLTHFTDGEIPLDCEPKQFMASQYLPRWICLILESKDWSDTPLATAGYGGQEPFIIRYERKQLLQWQGKDHEYAQWSDPGEIEAPKQQ
jgi:hypothetical protein